MSFVIRCTCGHQFTRATICRPDLRLWQCPKNRKGLFKGHQTRGAFR